MACIYIYSKLIKFLSLFANILKIYLLLQNYFLLRKLFMT